jgi:hypothetical protein
MSDETQNELPVDVTAKTTANSSFDVLKKYGLDLGKKAFEAANATLSPKAPDQATVSLPQLLESTQTGYRNGVANPIVCCMVGAHLIEKNTAYDYILMSNAASKAGVTLRVSSGFRTNEEQTRLFEERKNPAVAAVKGVAARPGYSNHQSGIALDLNVGMTKADYIAGRYTAAYLWLVKYGGEFGFDHVEGAKVNEPWHWTHLQMKIVGTAAFQAATGLAVLTTDTAVNAAASGQSGTLRLTNLEGHDDTVSLARATSFSQSSRQTMLTERSIFSANASSYVSSRVSQLQASKLTLEEEPKAFEQATINPLVYNFATGLWGDNKAV